jgi:hypothetical protein
MKFFRIDLLTLLISLFILGSCKNQNDIGLPVGDQQINGTLMVYDDIVIKTDTDNVPTQAPGAGSVKVALSDLNDNILGATQSGIAAALNLPGGTAYTVPTGTVTTDSVVMELRYTDGFYGDSLNSKYRVNVYPLKEKIGQNVYYVNRAWSYDSLATLNSTASAVNIRPKTRVRMFNIIKGAPDTLRNVAAHLRIRLNNNTIPNLLFNNATAIASTTAFQTAFNGIYLSLRRDQASQVGGTAMFNLDSSRVNVYYRVVNNGVTDTSVVTLPVISNVPYIKPRYNTYPAAVKSALTSTASDQTFYLQGLAGLRAKVSFPNLKTMFGSADVSSIAINRAELVVTPKPGTYLPPFVPQPQLTMYRLDIAKQRQQLPDANGTSSSALDPRFFSTAVFGGYFLPVQKEYHFVITGYLQDLLRGRITDYGTYIGTIDTTSRTTQVAISSTIQTAGRVVAVGTDKSSPYRLKLNVIYTKNN